GRRVDEIHSRNPRGVWQWIERFCQGERGRVKQVGWNLTTRKRLPAGDVSVCAGHGRKGIIDRRTSGEIAIKLRRRRQQRGVVRRLPNSNSLIPTVDIPRFLPR